MPAYLTVDQVAERLHTPSETVRFWIHTRKLPAYKPGRRLLVSEHDLAAFVDASAIGAPAARKRVRR